MNLKLIGADCSNGLKIIKNLNKIERELDFSIKIDKITSENKSRYNVKVVPTLMVENEVVSVGNVPSERELKNILKRYAVDC